jgi:multiple antibiotic resistance protein
MLSFTEYTKIFISLIAIIDPVGTIPLVIAFTAGMSQQKRARTGRLASLTVGGILIAALLMGEALLHFFGISIHSFRTAGGILLLLMSIDMLVGTHNAPVFDSKEAGEATSSLAIVPLSTPLLAGPGAISAVILDAHKSSSLMHYSLMALVIVLLSLVVWLMFTIAPRISQRLGKTGIDISTRLMGLILASIAVEFIAGGLRGLFPALG